MAAGTWTNATENGDWSNAGNWSGVAAPGNGETATFDGSEAARGLPDGTDNEPSAGAINIVIAEAITANLEGNLFHGKGATIGAVTVNHASANITAGADITGNITMATGTLNIAAARALSGSVDLMGGTFALDASGVVASADSFNMSAGSTLTIAAGTTLDLAALMSVNSTADSIVNAGIIQGTVNMTAAVWTGTGAIAVDQDGTLNLGTDTANSQSVTVTAAAVTLGDSFTCKSFVLNKDGGVLTVTGGKTITADTVTLTDGALDSAGSLNVAMTGTGGLSWNSTYNKGLGTVTFSAGCTTTAGDTVVCAKVAGAGTVVGNSKKIDLRPTADAFWTLTTAADGCLIINIYATAARSNATLINAGTSPVLIGSAQTYTLTGGLTCAGLTMNGTGATLDLDGGNLTCTDLKFDTANDTLTLGSGTHTITTIARVLDETGCALNIDGTTTISSTVNLAGITCTIAATATTTLAGAVTASAAGTFTLGGNVTFTASLTLANMTVDFGAGIITGTVGTETINAASATSLADSGAQIRNCTVSNFADYGTRRLRVRHVIEGASMTKRLLHLDYPRHRAGRFRRDSGRL